MHSFASLSVFSMYAQILSAYKSRHIKKIISNFYFLDIFKRKNCSMRTNALKGEIITKSVYISLNNNTNLKSFQILSIYTIWDGIAKKTISRYYPFKFRRGGVRWELHRGPGGLSLPRPEHCPLWGFQVLKQRSKECTSSSNQHLAQCAYRLMEAGARGLLGWVCNCVCENVKAVCCVQCDNRQTELT